MAGGGAWAAPRAGPWGRRPRVRPPARPTRLARPMRLERVTIHCWFVRRYPCLCSRFWVGFFWGDSVEIDALGARTGGRFEQQRERNDEQEGDAGQNEHPLEGQQRRLSVEHPVEDATGLLARRAR